MKAKFSKPMVISIAVAASMLVGGFGVSRSEAALNWLGVQQKLDNHDQRLDNQDARIGNTEKDVTKLQESTNTKPSDNHQNTPAVTSPNPTLTQTPDSPPPSPQPTPAPIATIVAYEVIPNGQEFNCKWTYSDGTSSTFRWKWPGTTGSGGLAWESRGYCDQNAIGLPKP